MSGDPYCALRCQPMAATDDPSQHLRMPSPRLLLGRRSCREAVYATTSVVHERVPLFSEDHLVQLVVRELARCHEERRAENLAWVVMPDHVHWLFQLREGTLAACVQAFKSRAAREVNRMRATSGQLWQAGYYEHRVRDDEDLRMQARYIVANPLRRGIVDRLADYPYWYCAWLSDEGDL